MADSTDDTAKSAEQAYAAAASEANVSPAGKPAAAAPAPAKLVAAPQAAAPQKPAAPRRKTEKPADPKPARKIAIAKAAKRAARVARAAAAPAPAKTVEPKLTVSELKEKIMATAKTTDFSKPIVDAFGEYQTRAKAAYEKGTEVATEKLAKVAYAKPLHPPGSSPPGGSFGPGSASCPARLRLGHGSKC